MISRPCDLNDDKKKEKKNMSGNAPFCNLWKFLVSPSPRVADFRKMQDLEENTQRSRG